MASEEVFEKKVSLTIPWYDFKMWPTSTRAIVGAVLLGVCFSATMQITERIDTVLTGGILNIFGFIFQNVWFWPAAMYFGLTGGLIAANFSPFIAVLTATGPLAPAWFAVNTAHVIPMAYLSQRAFEQRKDTKEGITMRYFMTFMVPFAQIFTVLPLVGVWLLIFNFPVWIVIVLFFAAWALCFPGGFLGFYLSRSIGRSGIV
jgi:hypothetical protein